MKAAKAAELVAEAKKDWDPSKHEGDAFKTLFVGRMQYSVDEDVLTKEMERYGRIKSVPPPALPPPRRPPPP